jgi:precorrin-6A/cobalt-precorrin-6A reductase
VPDPRLRILILGGTGDARALAGAIVERFGARVDVLTSLAGATRSPARIQGRLRSGGFGGAARLAGFLRAERIDLLVDATHPFASRISQAADQATAEAGVTLLRLDRAVWRAGPDDRWIEAADAQQAARRLPGLGRRAFLTIGRRGLAPFAAVPDLWFLVRTIEALDPPSPAMTMITGRGPFTLEDELRLIDRYRIDVLVTKASGGDATAAKLVAARQRHIPVVMIARPEALAAGVDVAAILRWIADRLQV